MVKILLADDSRFTRKVVSDILSKNGYTDIVEAKDGVETVEKYNSEKPELVLLDIIMDKLNGVEALKKIMAINKDAKVVIISAVGQARIIKTCIEIGAREYIIKPVDEKKLIPVIKKLS